MRRIAAGLAIAALCASALLLGADEVAAESSAVEAAPGTCGAGASLALQILGSGGPELRAGRASAAYIVWIEGRARLLIDVGGGSFLRFGEAGAAVEDLWHIGLTHVHVDHSADLAVLVKAGYFTPRSRALGISGPSGAGAFPPLDEFLRRLFGEGGAYAYLRGALDGSDGQFALQPRVVDATPGRRERVFDRDAVQVEAIGVRHGPVPALAYIVSTAGHTVVFAGDQDGKTRSFWTAAADADILVAHVAITDDAGPVASRLHATPTRWAAGAARARVKRLVLSHLMARSLAAMENVQAAIAAEYAGPVMLAQDRACVVID
ncbi:MAG: MBL fold metallo-hydrolase [Gammaproteobacteria bacterium]